MNLLHKLLLPFLHKKRALYSYIDSVVKLEDNSEYLSGHSNKWESREIAHLIMGLGYKLDCISWVDNEFIPSTKYDLVFDIYTNLHRLKDYYELGTNKLLHLTGSYGPFQNNAELERIQAFEERTGVKYTPKRQVLDIPGYLASLEIADHCSLIGNQYTLSTFPEKYRQKITPIPDTSSTISLIKNSDNYIPPNKEFIWFFGAGGVHKGLDLVLEVFKKRKNFTLNVVGNIETETDFFEAYGPTLLNSSNINYYGYLDTSEPKLIEIFSRCFCIIGPSCSEGMSTAIATGLKIGLFPIISHNTGITLPVNCGFFLQNNTIEEIDSKVCQVMMMNDSQIIEQIHEIQELALLTHSRSNFTKLMNAYLLSCINPE
jgi:hypothetical protein